MKTINNYKEFIQIINEHETCFVKIGTTWCGPCKLTQQNAEEVEKVNKNVYFINVEADNADDEFIERYSIKSVPVTLVFKNGDLISKEMGLQTKEQIENRLK